MAARKQSVKEPLLNTVARKLGHAAGALTKVTHDLTKNLSELPEAATTKARETAGVGAPAKRSRSQSRHPKKKVPGRKHKAVSRPTPKPASKK